MTSTLAHMHSTLQVKAPIFGTQGEKHWCIQDASVTVVGMEILCWAEKLADKQTIMFFLCPGVSGDSC